MNTTLATVVHRRHDGPGTIVAGTPYPDLVDLVARMQAEDSRIIFDSLRPMGDELWNMIDGTRTVAELAEAVCLEFDFTLSPELFLPLFDGSMASNQIGIGPTSAAPASGTGEEAPQ